MKINILNILCCFILALSSTVAQNPTDACGPAVQALAVNSSNSCIPSAYTLPGSYSNGGANNASCVSGQDRDDGWYQFTAINNPTTIEMNGDQNFALAVYTGSCGSGEIACSMQNAGTPASLTINTTVGLTYFIQVHRRGGNNTVTMTGTVCVYSPTPTCSDGIQNQGETWIDCGGPCPACPPATCSDGIQNQGETGVDCGGPCPPCTLYTHGTTGINSERVTHCLEATCGGVYTDDGGASADYALNVAGGVYRVFCPSMPNRCMQMTFTSFDMETNFDYITVGNGATQNSPVFIQAPADPVNGRITGTPTVPFSFTADSDNGCLSVRFTSDFSVSAPGWSANLSCVPCPTAAGPSGLENNDCMNATPLCSGTTQNFNSTGPGIVAEGCTGAACPAGGENHTNWYSFTIQTSGTLTSTITPQTGTDDYDFAIYGPNVSCTTLGAPIRCTDAGATGTTGLTATAIDHNEDVLGDKFLSEMNVIAGQTYLMAIDEWSANTGSGYSLGFGGTASLDCIVLLPVKLESFGSAYNSIQKVVDIEWSTNKETHIDYYEVQKSYNAVNFESLEEIAVTGNSYASKNYHTVDANPLYDGITYYRLKYGMKDGSMTKYSEVVAVQVHDPVYNSVVVQPNPVHDILKVKFDADEAGYALFQLIDITGKTHQEYQQTVYQGRNSNQFLLSSLPKGVYYLQVYIGTKSYRRKFIKS